MLRADAGGEREAPDSVSVLGVQELTEQQLGGFII
jgi:hypothetical protein